MDFKEKMETVLAPHIVELRKKLASLPTTAILNHYQLQIDAVQTDTKNVPDGFMSKWRYLWAIALSGDFKDGSVDSDAVFGPIDELLEKIFDTYALGAVYEPGRVRGSEKEFLARMGLAIKVREPDVLGYPEQFEEWGRRRLEPFNETYFAANYGIPYGKILKWMRAGIEICQDRLNARAQELVSIARDVRPIAEDFGSGDLNPAEARRKADELQLGERLEKNATKMEQVHILSRDDLARGVAPDVLKKLLARFAVRPGELDSEFTFPHDESPLEDKLFVSLPDGSFYFLDPASAFRIAVKTFEKDIIATPSLRDKYLRNRDRSAEQWVTENLRNVLPTAEFFPNYFLAKGVHEKDLLIRFGDTLLLVECKNSKIRSFAGTAADLMKFERDFESSVQYGFEQALEVKKRICDAEESVFVDKKGRRFFSVKRTEVRKIYILCVTTTTRGPFGTDLSYQLEKPADEPFPLALNLFDLNTICKNFGSAEQFLGFLEARQSMHGRVSTGDELNFAGYYLKYGNLDISEKTQLTDEFSGIFDRAWYREKGIDVEEPRGRPTSTSMVRSGNRVVVQRSGSRAESIRVPPAIVQRATGKPVIRMKGADRNKPCPCGSGRKLKHCHGA